ncbi:hypothetical protein ACS0TY_025906 [Phlomoides rotata]
MIGDIDVVRVKGDSVGGVATCIVRNVPWGLGSPVFDKLEAELAKVALSLKAGMDKFGMVLSINFKCIMDHIHFHGGISNGETINMRIAFKQTSTISRKQNTVTEDKHDTKLIARGRHDPCVVPRWFHRSSSLPLASGRQFLSLHHGGGRLFLTCPIVWTALAHARGFPSRRVAWARSRDWLHRVMLLLFRRYCRYALRIMLWAPLFADAIANHKTELVSSVTLEAMKPDRKGLYYTVTVDEQLYKDGVSEFQDSLIGQIILVRGDKPLTEDRDKGLTGSTKHWVLKTFLAPQGKVDSAQVPAKDSADAPQAGVACSNSFDALENHILEDQ